MKKILPLLLFFIIFSIFAFAKTSNPTFNSNDGIIDFVHLTSTTTYKFNLLEDNNNLSIKMTDSDSTILVMDYVSGEVLNSTNSNELSNEVYIENIPKGEYSILFRGSGDFSIFTNNIDIKNILTLEVAFDSYEFTLDKVYNDVVISEIYESAFLTLSSTTNSNLYYQNIKEPFNTLNIDSLEIGTYQLNVTITPTTNNINNEAIDEPTIIPADEIFKVSNPIIKSNSGEIKLIYTGYNKDYKLILNSDEKDITIKNSTKNCEIGIWSLTDNNLILDGCEAGVDGDMNIPFLSAGEYMIQTFNSELELLNSSSNEDLMKYTTLIVQSDHYEFISKNDLTNIYIEESNENSTISLFSIDNFNVTFNSEESFLNIDELIAGRYQINININYEVATKPIEESIDKSQKFSNPKLSANGKEIELFYNGFTREYILNLDEPQTNLIIEKESDCGIFVKRLEDEDFKGICKDTTTNKFKADRVEAGSYNIHIVGNEEFKLYSDSGSLKDKLELVGKSDSYIFSLSSITRDIDLTDLNESVEVSIIGKVIDYHNIIAPYNSLNVPLLSEGDYEVVVYTSTLKEKKIVEVDEKYKFSNPKFLIGDVELKVFYTNFSRHYHFKAERDYKNIVITKEGDGCGVIVKNLSNGGEVITSCKNEIKNRLNMDLVKSGDYIVTIIGSEEFNITSDNEDLKDILKFCAKSDNYSFILDKVSRDILISENNESAKVEIYDTKNEEFTYSKNEAPFNFMSIPYLRAGTYAVNIIALMDINTSVKRPDSAEIFADDNKTEIKLKPIELESGNIANIKTIIDNKGKVEAIIGISDKAEKIIKQTILKGPKGAEVEMDEVGNLKQILTTTKVKAEIVAESGGRIEAKISINDNENLKREFIVPAGSQTEVKEDGSTTSTSELESDKGNYEANVEVSADGKVSASAFLYEEANSRSTKISTGLLTASYSARREFSSVKVEFIWDEVESRKLRKITSGLLKATYTTRREFSFDGEEATSRAIDVSDSKTIIIIPSPEATFEENQYFLGENEGYRTIKLTEGEANISIDGEVSIMSDDEYVLPKIDGKELYLHEGWNLISTPIDVVVSGDVTSEDANYTLDSFGSYVELWKFDSNGTWEKNPDEVSSGDGFWIYLNAENNSLFVGSGYDIDLENLDSGWTLLGAGKDLENLKEEYDFNKIYKFSRENNESTWIEDPNIIYRGEGFWINKN